MVQSLLSFIQQQTEQGPPADTGTLTAFVHKSFRLRGTGAACCFLSAVCVSGCTSMSNQLRWHFQNERPAARRSFITTVADLHVLGVEGLTG